MPLIANMSIAEYQKNIFINIQTKKMQKNIYEIFDSLSKSNKDLARIQISEYAGVTIGTITMHWLSLKKGIPLKYKEKCLEIVSNILQDQIDGYQKLINLKSKKNVNT